MKSRASLLMILLPAAGFGAEPPPNPGTALITGSDRGIGFAMVREFALDAGTPTTAPTSTPADVAHAMVLTIELLGPEQNGRFYSLAGRQLPW